MARESADAQQWATREIAWDGGESFPLSRGLNLGQAPLEVNHPNRERRELRMLGVERKSRGRERGADVGYSGGRGG